MKKSLVIVALLAMSIASAHAAINVTVSGLSGFYQEDDTTPIMSTSNHAWLQIIFLSSGSPTQAGIGGGIGANESILEEFALTKGVNSDGDGFGTFVYDLIEPYQAGSWYVRIFTGGSSTTGLTGDNIIEDMWYYESAVFATINNLTPETPDSQSIQGNNPSSAFEGADFLNRQVVPEPSTLAFLGIGGLALALRRRFIA